VDSPWTGWLYWGVLLLAVVGVVAASVVRVAETTPGPAVIDTRERTFVALIATTDPPGPRRGDDVRLQLDGTPGRTLAAQVTDVRAADAAAARRAGFPHASDPATLLRGVLAPEVDVGALPSPPRLEARAVVTLRSDRVLDLFLRQFSGTPEQGGGS
jgi:hypothetical protein